MPSRAPLLVALVAVAAAMRPAAPVGAVAPGSRLIPCDQADTLVTITTSSHLDPSCTSRRMPGLVKFAARGRRGSYTVPPDALPACTASGRSVRCR